MLYIEDGNTTCPAIIQGTNTPASCFRHPCTIPCVLVVCLRKAASNDGCSNPQSPPGLFVMHAQPTTSGQVALSTYKGESEVCRATILVSRLEDGLAGGFGTERRARESRKRATGRRPLIWRVQWC